MNKQEFIINTLKPYFLDKSLCATALNEDSGTTVCRYRTADGRKCAVGQHIPDEKYDQKIEGDGISDEIMDMMTKEAKQTISSQDEWTTIQLIHDGLAQNTKDLLRRIYDCEVACTVDLTELKELASLT
jgi:hypothetical protein